MGHRLTRHSSGQRRCASLPLNSNLSARAVKSEGRAGNYLHSGPHQHSASQSTCRRRWRFLRREARPFRLNDFRRQAFVAVSSSSAKAYRGRMPRLNIALAPNPQLQRTRSAPLRSPLSRKPFGAAVKFRAGGRHVVEHGAAQHRPCVHRSILASTAGRWARPTPWHLEGLTAKAYRATRGIQLI
jgi:hypothetical protein